MTQTPQTARCCGAPVHVVALTGDDPARGAVQLVRCGGCGLNTWMLNGAEVDKTEALGALTQAFAPTTPHVRHSSRRFRPVTGRAVPTPPAPPAPPAPQAELSGLLAGWQVLGAS